jgi:hypothetical protein
LDTKKSSAWIRLVKKDDVFEMYSSADGISWELFTSTSVYLPENYRIGLAFSTNNDWHIGEATFENFQIGDFSYPTAAPSISNAPTPWTPAYDVGDVVRTVEFHPENVNGVTVIKASGSGIWGRHDSYSSYSEQRPLGSNFEVVCLVDALYGWHGQFTKGGLMIRNGKNSDAAHAFIAINRDEGVLFQSRNEAGSRTTHHSYTEVPNIFTWLKLKKTGNTIEAYYKHSTAADWTLAGSTELTLIGDQVQVGLALTSGFVEPYAYTGLNVKNYEVVGSV